MTRPPPARSGVAKRLFPRSLVFVLTIVLAACASPIGGKQSFASSAGRVFSTAYQHIRERYIDRVTVEQIAVNGMRGLKEIDTDIEIVRRGDNIRLIKGGKQVALFKAPPRNDVDGWARLTAAIVETSRTYSPKLQDAKAEQLYKVVFDAALSKLDKYSRYAPADLARENRALRSGFGGIGVQIRQDEGATKIVTVFPDTPAEKAGLKAGDVIVKVDGVPLAGLTLRQVVTRLRGPDGSAVGLEIGRKSEKEPLAVRVKRAHVIASSVFLKTQSNVAYVRITRFNQRTAADLARALYRARRQMGASFQGVILDLRDNPGGLLDQAVEVSDLFLSGGRIVSTEGRHPGSFQRYDAGEGDLAGGKPMVVLVNGRSASSSEIVAAALQDLNRAVLVGSTTFGKGTVQSVFRLPNDGELVLTWSRFHAPSGYTLQDLGVLPQVCVTGPKRTLEAQIAALKSGTPRTTEALPVWRQQRRPTHDRLTRLRKVCPSSEQADGDRAVSLARRIIKDDGLYARMLRLAHTSVATR